ncbi:MAG TPA: FUSC family protein [Terriglobia bacterium]|nr:FUSC family protein [Terriglobia bacterium]
MIRWPFLSPGWSHAVCTTIAVILALYVAYFLQLENPYSAATTVLVVASPIHGMVLAKSVYRFLGTLLGAAASILLMACFAQTPELFLLGTALWVGLFTAASSLLRRFRAYGAVLAGYTITLVAFGAVDKPLSIFDLAMARISVVTVGIACSALVTILLAPNTASRDFPQKLKGALQSAADFVTLALSPGDEKRIAAGRLLAARQIQALDTALYGAAAETAEMAHRSGYIRRAVAALFGLLTSASSLRVFGDMPAARHADNEIGPLLQQSAALLQRLAAVDGAAAMSGEVKALRQRCAVAQARLDMAASPSSIIAFNRLDDFLDHLSALVDSLVAFTDRKARPLDIRLPHHRDLPAALINGLRGMMAVLLVSVLWIYTAWPNGNQVFGATVPICALLGASERPQADAVDFFKGVLLAAIAGLVCTYGLLAAISGFPLLALALAPFVLIGAYYSTRPRTMGIATGFLIFFITFVAPHNPMQFDLSGYFNTAFANLIGIGCVLPIFRVVFPQRSGRAVQNLARQLVISLMRLAGRPSLKRLLRWEHQAHDRLAAIAMRLPLEDGNRAKLLTGGFAAIRIARDLVRIKGQMETLPLDHATRTALLRVFEACRHLAGHPMQAVHHLRDAADRLQAGIPALPPDGAAMAKRAIAALRESADLLAQHESFFTGRKGRTDARPCQSVGQVATC